MAFWAAAWTLEEGAEEGLWLAAQAVRHTTAEWVDSVLETLPRAIVFIQSLQRQSRSRGPNGPRSTRSEIVARQLFDELHGTTALRAADDLGVRLVARVVGWERLGQ